MALLKIQNSKLKTKIGWLLKGLGLVVAFWLVFVLITRALQRIALVQIAELTNARIEAHSVDFDLNGSVFIEKLVIRPEREHKYDDAILKAETVYARFGIGSLLLLRPRLKEIRVSNFVFDAQHDLNTDQWNVAALKIKPPKGGSKKMPLIDLEGGTLKYSKVSNGRVKVIAAVPIDARFGHIEDDEKPVAAEKRREGYSFNITTAEAVGGFGKSNLTGFWRPGNIVITGGVSSADIPAFERVWLINVSAAELNYDRSNNYSLKLRIRDLVSKHRAADETSAFDRPLFWQKFGAFAALQRFFSRYRPWGRVDIDVEASGNLERLAESTLVGKVYCKDICIRDRKFPYTVEHLAGQIDFTEKGAVLNNLSGEHGGVKLFFNGWSRDFGANWKYQIRVTSDNMALDDDLYDALSAKEKKFWSVFSPRGFAAIDYRLSQQSQTEKKRALGVRLLGTEAAYRNFSYPLKNLSGNLFFDRDSIIFSDLVSQWDGRKIKINGKVTECETDRPIYDISIVAKDVPLDSTLAEALSERQRYLYNRLNMAGLADAEIKVFTSEDDFDLVDFTADVSLKKTFLKAEDFPLAISDVSAKTFITHDLIDIQNLTGSCERGLVSLTGRIWPGAEAEQLRYHLSLYTEQAQLNDDLFSLLPVSLRKMVSELQPEGTINYRVDLDKASGAELRDYRIVVDCLGNSIKFEPFPYPLKNITGSLTITTEGVEPRGVAAAAVDDAGVGGPKAPTIGITGQIAQVDDANSRFDLDLEDVRIFDAEGGEKYVDFAGTAKFKGCDLTTSPAITELDAVLKAKGLYKRGDWFCEGQAVLLAERLRIKGKSLTGLKADVDYDDRRKSWLTENLIADCYDGRLMGRFELRQSGGSALEYLLQVGFDDIDLEQFLSDTERKETGRNGYSSGEMDGSLSVRAGIGDGSSRIGRCCLQISDMEVGRLSPLAKLLSVLKLTEPTDFAFEQMLVDSYIKHNRLFFQRFDLSGDSVAFCGSGWMDLRTDNIDLLLTARGPRLATAEPSVLQSLTDALGWGVVRMEVSGNVYDPQVTTKTLPVIKDTLEILGTPR